MAIQQVLLFTVSNTFQKTKLIQLYIDFWPGSCFTDIESIHLAIESKRRIAPTRGWFHLTLKHVFSCQPMLILQQPEHKKLRHHVTTFSCTKSYSLESIGSYRTTLWYWLWRHKILILWQVVNSSDIIPCSNARFHEVLILLHLESALFKIWFEKKNYMWILESMDLCRAYKLSLMWFLIWY